MLPGHTKFWPDSYFGLLKKHYRRQDHIDNMADLVKCVCKCGQDVECVPQLYQNCMAVLWVERLLGPVVSASECICAFPYIWIWQGAPWCNGDKGHVISHKFHQDRHAQTWCESVRHATYYRAKRVVPPAVPVPVWKSDHDPTKSDN